jgi:anti-anti-sigma factor
MTMQLESRHIDNALIIAPAGRIDQAHADSFKAALDPHLIECKAGGTPIVLDFSGISYISSVGLRALMLAARQVKSQGGKIVICSLAPLVNEVFEISRFNLVFAVFADVNAALASLSA